MRTNEEKENKISKRAANYAQDFLSFFFFTLEFIPHIIQWVNKKEFTIANRKFFAIHISGDNAIVQSVVIVILLKIDCDLFSYFCGFSSLFLSGFFCTSNNFAFDEQAFTSMSDCEYSGISGKGAQFHEKRKWNIIFKQKR